MNGPRTPAERDAIARELGYADAADVEAEHRRVLIDHEDVADEMDDRREAALAEQESNR